MKAQELIEQLKKLDPNTEVGIEASCLWDCGCCFYWHRFAKFNIVEEDVKEGHIATIYVALNADKHDGDEY